MSEPAIIMTLSVDRESELSMSFKLDGVTHEEQVIAFSAFLAMLMRGRLDGTIRETILSASGAAVQPGCLPPPQASRLLLDGLVEALQVKKRPVMSPGEAALSLVGRWSE